MGLRRSGVGDDLVTEPGGQTASDSTDDAAEPAPIERSSIRQNVARMTSSQVAGWVIATLGSIIVPRYLGPVTQGRLQLASSLWSVAVVFTTLGTGLYLQP